MTELTETLYNNTPQEDEELLIAIQNVETQGSFVKNEITGRAMKEIMRLIKARDEQRNDVIAQGLKDLINAHKGLNSDTVTLELVEIALDLPLTQPPKGEQ